MASEPVCSFCSIDSSPIWRRTDDGRIICLECHTKVKKEDKASAIEHSARDVVSSSSTPPPLTQTTTRKRKGGRKGTKGGGGEKVSSVSSRSSHSTVVTPQQGRRTLIKGNPIKAPPPEPHLLTSDSVLHKGVAYEVGDVVSLLDYSGGIYYALIEGFLIDQYASHYAILKWVLPCTPNPTHFDPSNFILGPEDDQPRNLDLLDFVCHSPNSKSFNHSFTQNYDMAMKWLTT